VSYSNVISISIRKDIKDVVEQTQKNLGIKILIPLIIQTPVDTGRAKANWIVTQNLSTDDVIDAPSSAGTAQTSALVEGTKEIQKTTAYSRTFIQNNLPYINALNDGHSQQAPSKYVDIIVEKAIADNV
jgi:hypothetical protein